MQMVRTPRVIISGVRSGVGKSLLGLGLAIELRRRGISYSVCLLSPSIAQSSIYRRVSGRYTHCLDSRLLSAGQVLQGLHSASVGAELIIIDGSGGLYDGDGPGTLHGSDAEMAALTHTPVVLVADARGFGSSMAALIRGYENFANGFGVAGTIVNRVERSNGGLDGDARDRDYYEAVMQGLGLRRLLGGVPEASFDIPFLPGGFSQQQKADVIPRQFFTELGDLISEFVDIDRLIECAGKAGELIVPDASVPQSNRRCRIAVADDVCFGLCFQDNLDLLRSNGADLAPFSPIADTDIPSDIGGIYLTGGYLGEYGRDLGINVPMRKAILEFVKEGGLLFAEGSSAAYLCRQFRWGGAGEQAEGVGLFDVVASPGEGGLLFCDGATVDESILGSSGQLVKGINSDDWRFGREFPVLKALRVSSRGGRISTDGFCPTPHTLVTFGLWHFGSNPQIARNLVDAAEIAMVR